MEPLWHTDCKSVQSRNNCPKYSQFRSWKYFKSHTQHVFFFRNVNKHKAVWFKYLLPHYESDNHIHKFISRTCSMLWPSRWHHQSTAISTSRRRCCACCWVAQRKFWTTARASEGNSPYLRWLYNNQIVKFLITCLTWWVRPWPWWRLLALYVSVSGHWLEWEQDSS